MQPATRPLIRIVEVVNTLGFALIIGSIMYFIIGSVTSLVGGEMLDWTFCGSVRHLSGVEWCGVESPVKIPAVTYFVHHLLNAPIPWFMLFWGFFLTAVCALLLKALGHHYAPPGRRRGTDK